MIEKVMKVVKSSNKRRGRNITIGAVIGFLLSCTAVMGANDNYLWIKEDSKEIKFSIDGTTIFDGNWDEGNPYENAGNIWDTVTKTYTNNITLSSNGNNGKNTNGNDISYGLRLSGNLTDVNFVNNGSIMGIGSDVTYGIYNEGTITNLINNGSIESSDGYGIYNVDTITTLANNGLITGQNSGIENDYTITNLINNGSITAEGDVIYSHNTIGNLLNNGSMKTDGGYGINSNADIGTIMNNGLIKGGIWNQSNIISLENTGIIYEQFNEAIYNESSIDTINNYGILATQGNSVIDNEEDLNHENNYGLYITEADGKITVDDTKSKDSVEIVVGYDKDGKEITKSMTIRNATLNGDSGEATETVSFEFKGEVGEFDNSILNGKNETLKVSGTGNQITDSIINAYGTAVVMNENMSTLILDNTIVNGGISKDDGTISPVNIAGNGNTLTIQGDSVINGGDTVITVSGEKNALVLEGNVKINGEMKSTGTNNLISLNGNAEDGMNILHNISGFTNMNIENNVTLFEDIKVTGTETVTVHKNGVLNLRLKKSDDITYNTIPTAVHAFSGREEKHEMTIKGTSEGEAGTLNFITNGIGREIYVDMKNIELENMKVKANSIIDKAEIDDDYIHLGAGSDLSGIVNPKVSKYSSLNGIYKSLYSSTEENLDALRDILSMTYLGKNYDYNNATDEEQLKALMSYLDSIYTGTPYSYSSELSRKSMGMFRDIVTENQFRPDMNKWLVMGGLTHRDGGTKDSYYGQNYHGFDTGTADVDVDMKLTGAYALGKYGYSENVSLGVTAGGNRSEAKLPMSKVKGNSGYIGGFAENYRGNLTLKAGVGIQYSEYDADRGTLGGHSYSDKYSDITYDIYLNGRYSHNIGENLFLEPYGTLSYTYVDQEGADEGSKVLAIETDSKSFDYTAAKVGVDLKKVIPHEKGKSTVSAGVSYTRLLTGADEENITGRFKGGSDFDILVPHKNEHSIGLNAKYALELENGVLFDVKGSYSVERDSHNGIGKNRNKGEWIIGAGLGYKF